MRVRLRCFFLVCLLTFANLPAFAWNNIGHMAVAYIAWQNLTPAQRTRVSALVKLNPLYSVRWSNLIPVNITGDQRDMYLFMIAATWPDQIKGDMKDFPCDGHGNGDTVPTGEAVSLNTGYTDQCMHKYWHFVDVSYNPDGTPPHPTPAVNAEVKIDFLTGALHGAEPDTLKSYDLVWLEHLVGDIHQPLHCVTRYTSEEPEAGDQGGNKILIENSEKELHAYWDDVLGDKTSNLYSDARLAETVALGLPAADATLAADSKTADWKMESVTDAEDYAYNAPIGPGFGPYPISDGYHTNAVSVARKRVALAGVRLANLIKTIQP